MENKQIISEIQDGIGLITIDNPKANTITATVIEELNLILHKFESDQNVKVLIITGNGNKFFISGAEISEFVDKGTFQGLNHSKNLQHVFNKIENFPKPVIAAINGFCLGGGLELAMSCDIRYASINAKMGQPEINLGLIPGAGGTQRLSRLIGTGKAKELMFTGDFINSEEALALQLIQKVCSQEELLDECRILAKKIASKSPLILELLKKTINIGIESTLDHGLSVESDNFGLCFATNDKKEGVSAFLEKRPPKFTGS